MIGQFITYGCRAGTACRYSTVPCDLGTPYTRCPLCGGAWGVALPRLPMMSAPGVPYKPPREITSNAARRRVKQR
jgi:hypothetical protein